MRCKNVLLLVLVLVYQLVELIKKFILYISPFENNAHFLMILMRQEKHS